MTENRKANEMKYESMEQVPDKVLIEAYKCCRIDIALEEIKKADLEKDPSQYCKIAQCPLCGTDCAVEEEIARRFEMLTSK